MIPFDYIGFVAAFCTTSCFVPQAIFVIKTRNTQSISALSYVMLSFGVFLWLIFGILTNSAPLYISNAITFVLSTIILIVKLKNLSSGKDK